MEGVAELKTYIRKIEEEVRQTKTWTNENIHNIGRLTEMFEQHIKNDEKREIKIDTRLDKIDDKLSIIQQKLFNGINEKVQKFDCLESRVDEIEESLGAQGAIKKYDRTKKKYRLEIVAGIAGLMTLITGVLGVLSMLGVI
jgi:hypothetical protein